MGKRTKCGQLKTTNKNKTDLLTKIPLLGWEKVKYHWKIRDG